MARTEFGAPWQSKGDIGLDTAKLMPHNPPNRADSGILPRLSLPWAALLLASRQVCDYDARRLALGSRGMPPADSPQEFVRFPMVGALCVRCRGGSFSMKGSVPQWAQTGLYESSGFP